jgi:muconate cycloisomerase
VGESGILSAAGRIFAMANERFDNYEGAANRILLRKDVTTENLTYGSGGFADLSYRRANLWGLGVNVQTAMVMGSSQPVAARPLVTQSQAAALPRQIH